jgi:hypothetical protein
VDTDQLKNPALNAGQKSASADKYE